MGPRRDEAGMTLIELLIAMLITGIIMAPITIALIDTLSSNKATTQRITDTSGQQLASSYFHSDVQSSSCNSTASTCPPNPVNTAGPFVCGGTGTVLELTWNDLDANGNATGVHTVAYILKAGTPSELVRERCDSGASFIPLVNGLDGSVNPNPTVTCVPSPCGPTTATIDMHVWANSATTSPARSYYQPYDFDLMASRRS